MGRPSNTRISKPHPSPRFRDKVRLLCFRRGPADDIWAAEFMIDGVWTPRGGLSLATRDWDEAVEVARDKFTIASTGQRVARPYTATTAATPAIANPFRLYAERAISKLREIAQAQTVGGKAHNFLQLARRIERDLIPRWGDTDISKLTEHALNDWIADEYRVQDRATHTMTEPARTTLGNLDWALLKVWEEAAAAKIVERRNRPVIDKGLGEDSEPRAFIDTAGVQAVAKVMTDDWVAAGVPELRRSFRTYIALLATTGIRAGLEAQRIRIGDVSIREQAIVIRILNRQAKHAAGRSVVVYEGGPKDNEHSPEFPIRRLLRDQIEWRRSQGATDLDYCFPWPDTGKPPLYRLVLENVLVAANAKLDPMTGVRRVAYSFRHFFATRLIELGHSVPFIAAWLGTSSQMIERNYNRFLMEGQADQVSGVIPVVVQIDPWRSTDDDVLDELAERNA